MTREEYVRRYGEEPYSVPTKMTRSEFESRYGVAPPVNVEPRGQNVLQKALGGVRGAFEERVESASSQIERSQAGEISPARAGLRAVGEGAGFVGDVGFEAVKAVTPEPVEELFESSVEKIAQTGFAQKVLGGLESFKQRFPEASKDLGAIFNIGALIPATAAGGKLASKTTEKIVKKTGKALEARRVARINQAAQNLDETVGKIIQGKPADISKAKLALSQLDTSDVKTYAELGERIDDQVELLSTKVDDFFGAQKGSLKRDELIITTRVGDEVVAQNFVDDAIEQLKELYVKTKEAPALAKVNQLERKLDTEGLSRLELNNLAREYGVEFKGKAFSRVSGEPLTSVNAQAFENTRKGIKSVVRGLTDSKIPETLDRQISALLKTKPLVRKMETKVTQLFQRVNKRGLMERIARGLAGAVDVATFRAPSGFISRLLPSNVGLKTLNSIDLEKQLQKNLKKLDELLKLNNNDELVRDAIKLIDGLE